MASPTVAKDASVAADNAGTSGVSATSATITDAAGNTWTRRSETNYTPGGVVSDGTTLSIFTAPITSTLSSATITVNFSPDVTAKAAVLKKITPDTGHTIRFDSVGPGVTGTSTGLSSGNVSVASGYVFFGFVGGERNSGFTGDGDTTNGSWAANQSAAANTGAGTTSQGISGQSKITNASGNQSYDPTTGGATDAALNYVILYQVINAAFAVTGPTDVAAIHASLSTTASLAVTETADVAAFAAFVFHSTQLAATETADVAAFDADITIHNALAATETPDVAAFHVALSVEADLAVTETPDAAAFHVDIVLLAALASSEQPDRAEFIIAPVWPSALPFPILQGYSVNPATAVRRMAVEFGAPRVYRRTKRPLVDVAVAWQVDGWQQMLLDGFYSSMVDEGGRFFGVELPFPGAAGMTLVSARFKDKLSIQNLFPNRWKVSGTLEVLYRPVMTDAALTVILDDEGEEPTWPVGLLPQPTVNSWTIQPKPALVRSDDLPGLPRQRQRSRNSTAEAQANWELTETQAAILEAFIVHRGKDGAQWFAFPLYQGIGEIETKLRFLGESEWSPRPGGRWAVAAAIEIRERPVLSASDMSELLDEDTSMFGLIEELDALVDPGFFEAGL